MVRSKWPWLVAVNHQYADMQVITYWVMCLGEAKQAQECHYVSLVENSKIFPQVLSCKYALIFHRKCQETYFYIAQKLLLFSLVGLRWHAIQTYFLFNCTVQVKRHKECDYSVSVFPLILLSNYLRFMADYLWGRRLVCSMVFNLLYVIFTVLLVNTTVCCAVCHPHPLLYNTQTNRHEPLNVFLLLLTLLTLALVATDLWILNTERDVWGKMCAVSHKRLKMNRFHISRCCYHTMSDAQLIFTLWCIFLGPL